jgi:hypothetical protein
MKARLSMDIIHIMSKMDIMDTNQFRGKQNRLRSNTERRSSL